MKDYVWVNMNHLGFEINNCIETIRDADLKSELRQQRRTGDFWAYLQGVLNKELGLELSRNKTKEKYYGLVHGASKSHLSKGGLDQYDTDNLCNWFRETHDLERCKTICRTAMRSYKDSIMRNAGSSLLDSMGFIIELQIYSCDVSVRVINNARSISIADKALRTLHTLATADCSVPIKPPKIYTSEGLFGE